MGRVFALSDLHGQYNLWQQIKAFLQPDDILYFLGDAIDRGPKGYEIMKELLSDSRVIYIKGNHELMMQEALEEYEKNGEMFGGENYYRWTWNGCYPTLESWEANGCSLEWIRVLRELPVCKIYLNDEDREIYLCHAGFTPFTKPNNYDLVWDRDHIKHYIRDEISEEDGIVVVHGHTPTPILIDMLNQMSYCNQYQEKNGLVLYGNGAKIDIDCGSFATHRTVLLDLNTWESIPFMEE